MTHDLTQIIEKIIARNNPEELTVVQTLLEQFDGKETDTWMKKIYPFDMHFNGDTGFLKINRSALMNNSINILHGGMLMLIADTLMGTLCNEVVPIGKRVVTHEMNTYFTRKGLGDTITAEAKIIKKGSMTYLAVCEVFADGISIGYATGSFFVIDHPLQ